MHAKNDAVVAGEEPLVLTRTFDAPRELVFRAWVEPKRFAQWWGPHAFTNPRVELDVRAGGKIDVDMRGPDGTVYPMKGEFREVVAPSKLVFLTAVPGADGKSLFEVLNKVTFMESGGKTTMVLEAQVTMRTAGADQYLAGMSAGWGQSLERLGFLVGAAANPMVDRVLQVTREFYAPRELVWEVWTDPRHLAQWWGPTGFTISTFNMEVKKGGVWRFVMHGPDGTDYQNKVTYLEVTKPEKLVFQHTGGDDETEPVSHTTTATFEDVGNGRTRVTMHALFASAEAKRYVVENYGAEIGMYQTIERLGEKLFASATKAEPFVITRTFDAPRDLVWRAWTEKENLQEWFGPKAFKKMTTANMDFRVGGRFHYSMETPDGKTMWGKFEYREILPQSRIVWINSFSDPEGGVTRHPFTKDPWPLQMLTVVSFGEYQGKTTVTIQWQPYESTEDERKTFDAGRQSMTMGWTGTLDRLTEFFAKPR